MRQSATVGCDDRAEATPVTASSQNERGVGDEEFSRFIGGHNGKAEQEGFADAPPRELMPHDGTQRRPQGHNVIEKESSAAPAEAYVHLTPGSSCAKGEESGWHDRKEEFSTGGAPSGFPCEDGVSDEHVSGRLPTAAVVDDGDNEHESNGNNAISAASSSKTQRQTEAESRAAGAAAAPPGQAREEASLRPGCQRPVADERVNNVRDELDKPMPADQAPPAEEGEEKTNHAVSSSGKRGQAQKLADEPNATGTIGYDGEGQEAVEDETIGTGNEQERFSDTQATRNESRATAINLIPHDEASADAMSFVKDDDVSGSDDEFGKGVAKYVGGQQQHQGQRRRQSSEGGEGARSSGRRGESSDEIHPGEALQQFSSSAIKAMFHFDVPGTNPNLSAA